MAESSAINPKQCKFVLSQRKFVLSVQICVISANLCYQCEFLLSVQISVISANFCYKCKLLLSVQVSVISANFCYQCKLLLSVQTSVITFWREKNLHEKSKYGGEGSANSVNISLKCEVNSTLILPVKCPLTKLEES